MSVAKSVIYNKNHNCFGLCVNAVLSREIGENTDYVWNQAATVVHKDESMVYLTPYYESVEDHLKRVANIDMYSRCFKDFDSFHHKSVDIIGKGKSFIICLDVFELPFNLYYKNKHSLHFVEVVEIENDEYYICDHFYKYNGAVKKDIINSATSSLVNNKLLGCFQIYDFNFDNMDLTSSLDIKYILESNVNANYGRLSKETNLLRYEGKCIQIGLYNFEDFQNYIRDDALKFKKNISIIYKNLYGFGSSRNNYSNYLKRFTLEYPELKEIAASYEIIAQEFKIAANYILRLNFVDLNDSLMDKIAQRIESAYLLEKQINESILDVLNDL